MDPYLVQGIWFLIVIIYLILKFLGFNYQELF